MATEKRRKKYSDDDLEKALTAVRSGKTISNVSKTMGIPRTTLLYKYRGKLPIGKNVGPTPFLTKNEEAEVVKWIMHLSQRGFPIVKSQLINSVQLLIKNLARNTPFKHGRPGRHWYESFLKRHPEITSRISQNLCHSRASVTETAIRGWFTEVKQHLEQLNLIDIDKSRIFKCDESAFFLCPKGERVLVKKGDKAVYNFTQNDDKECLTVLFMTNANGQLPPPMIIFPYQRIPYSISQSIPDGWGVGKSDKGWMTAETFFEYITNIFHPWLLQNEIPRPVILYVDGHCSHLTMPLSQFCIQNGIELIALYPNATHLMQPLDVAFFRPLKAAWKKMVQEWRTKQSGKRLRKEDFGSLLDKSIQILNVPEIMVNGFRACGLFPFSADALQYNSLLMKQKINNTTNIQAFSKEEGQKYLNFFEQYIDAEVLKAFTKAKKKRIWDGELENKGLFNFWLSLQNLPSNFF
ncbi:uncharacterized protein [Linepithema humile]|uniref:uncharacterized protein n=1 Tax=Linepithema humile TaxID=83485 RepID=UPI00351F244D